MSHIVPQGNRFGEVFVEAQRAAEGAGDLGDLERVGQAGSVVVTHRGDEHLRLVLEAAERLAVQDAIPVLHEHRAHGILGFGARSTFTFAG